MELVEAADLLGIQMDDLQVCEIFPLMHKHLYVDQLFVGESFSLLCPCTLIIVCRRWE